MWVHSQLCSEVKEKRRKKKDSMCCTMYQYSQVYHKSVNGWNCIYIQAAATAATAATLSSSLKEICHTIFPLFINSSQREHSHPSTNYFHILPRFPSVLHSRELIERKKKKKKDAQAALVSSHAQSWLTSHPPTYTLSTIFQTADTAEAVPAFKKNYHGSEQLLCYLFTRVCSVFCFTPLFVWLL